MKKLFLIIPFLVCLSFFCVTAASAESTDVSESTSSVISSEYVSDDSEQSSITEESNEDIISDDKTSENTGKYPTEKQKQTTAIITIIFVAIMLCVGGVLTIKVN